MDDLLQEKQGKLICFIRQVVFEGIRDRMKILCLVTSNLNESSVNFLQFYYDNLDGDGEFDYQQTFKNVNLAMHQNELMDDTRLSTVLTLRALNATSLFGNTLNMIKSTNLQCYMLSWKIPSESLQKITIHWKEQGIYAPITDRWTDFCERYPGENYYIRYIGQLTTNSSLANKLSALKNRKEGKISSFFDSLSKIENGGMIERSASCYYIEPFQHSQNNDDKITNQDQLDQQEQMLISFFGLDNLLNTQPGGLVPAYSPGNTKFNEYNNLPTKQNFFNVFRQLSSAADPQFSIHIKNWVEVVDREYFNYKDRVDKASKNALWSIMANLRVSPAGLSNSYIKTIADQALPRLTVNGHVVLAAVCTNVSKSAQSVTVSYFNYQASASSRIVCDNLSRLESWQNGVNTWVKQSYNDIFPFVNILPWTTYGDDKNLTLEEGVPQVNYYLQSTLPLVTLSIGEGATKCALANFLHSRSSMSSHYVQDIVGFPMLIPIHDVELIDNPDIEDMPSNAPLTVVIPHIHSGVDIYTSRTVPGYRLVMDLVWQITLAIGEIATIEAHNSNYNDRNELVTIIFSKCDPNSYSLDPSLRVLYDRLQEAKSVHVEVQAIEDNINRRKFNKPSNRDYFKHGVENTRMFYNGTAAGEPHSEERIQQCKQLWKINYPDLHLHMPRESKSDWMEWATTRKTGSHYFASALFALSVRGRDPLWHVLRRFKPSTYTEDNDNWMTDEGYRKQALLEWKADVQTYYKEDHFSSENQRKRVMIYHQRSKGISYQKVVENTESNCQKKGYVNIYHINENGKEVSFKLYVNKMKHRLDKLRCTINFVKDGIQFTRNDNNEKEVYSLGRIFDHNDKTGLLKLWNSERRRIDENHQDE